MAFWGNSDGAKHPGCIISCAAPHRKVLGEKYDCAQRSLKTVKIWPGGVTIFDVPVTRAPNFVVCLDGTWDGILRTSTTLKRHKNNFYDHFGVISWLHDKIIIGRWVGFWGNSDGAMRYNLIRTP